MTRGIGLLALGPHDHKMLTEGVFKGIVDGEILHFVFSL